MESLKPLRKALAVAGVAVIVAGLAVCLPAQKNQMTTAGSDTDTGIPMAVKGLVRDVACPMQNHTSNATSFNLKCALACAKSGSPLIILTKAGEIYFPMSDVMPDPSQREKLMPFVGKFVRVSGTVYRRNGTRTIVIKDMVELKDVELNSTLGD